MIILEIEIVPVNESLTTGDLFTSKVDQLKNEWSRPVTKSDSRDCKVCRKPVTLNPLWGGCHC